jgi:[ribosomal protein S18]-alanine N-acetyltransferase
LSAEAKPQPGFIIVWEFRVKPEKRREFEEAYGREGIWAEFFRSGDGYIRIELRADPNSTGRYLTLDYWVSRAAFADFKHDHAANYQAIDQKCESLTAEEKFLGHCNNLEQLRFLLAERGFELDEKPRIREATPSDIPAILAIAQAASSAAQWTAKTYKEIFDPKAPARIALVAENFGTLDGFAIARLSTDDCELENIVVRAEQQRRGIGRQLLRELISSSRSKKARRIFLEVRESNMPARALYEKCGFTISGRRAPYYSNPAEDALTYALGL